MGIPLFHEKRNRGGLSAISFFRASKKDAASIPNATNKFVCLAIAGKKEQESIFKLREVEKETIFDVYPNPAKDFITIEFGAYEASSGARIEIINSVGNVVLSVNSNLQGSQNISLGELPTGLYILRIMDGEAEVQKEVVEIIK